MFKILICLLYIKYKGNRLVSKTVHYYYFLTPVLNSQGVKKVMLCNTKKDKKSSWNEPYSSSSFTKLSCSKMELYC